MLLAILIALSCMMIGVMVIQSLFKPAILQPLRIAIVAEGEQGELVEAVMPLINQMDSIKGICQMRCISEKDARLGIQKGTYDVAVILDEDFYSEMNDYENPEVDFLMAEHSKANTVMFRELIQDGVALIRTTEAAMLSANKVLEEDGAAISKGESEQFLLETIITNAVMSSNTYDKIGVTDMAGYPMLAYYGASILIVSLLTCGVCFGRLYSSENHLVEQMLGRQGVGIFRLGIYHVLPMASLLFVLGVMELLIWRMVQPGSLGIGIVSVAVLSLSIAAFFHMIYAWMGYQSSSGMILSLSIVILVLLSGCLVPTVYFPEVLYRMSAFNPVNIWQNVLLIGMEDGYFSGILVETGIVGLVCFGIAEVGMWKKM